ncbi:MAG: molybdopterin-dependent oxidoreductase [Lysobacter sp.]|nr:molybdopterin-dependent oxidoreductase [Lysobacter sp.]
MHPNRTALAIAVLCLGLCWAAVGAAAETAKSPHAHASDPPQRMAPVDVALDADRLAALPRVTAVGSAHGETLSCEGVSLAALLRASGAMPAEPLRGAQLARVVVISARDGYRAAYSLAELDASLGAREVVLTNRCNGAALDADDGPWRLIAPGESRPARWVRQIESIRVIDAP